MSTWRGSAGAYAVVTVTRTHEVTTEEEKARERQWEPDVPWVSREEGPSSCGSKTPRMEEPHRGPGNGESGGAESDCPRPRRFYGGRGRDIEHGTSETGGKMTAALKRIRCKM